MKVQRISVSLKDQVGFNSSCPVSVSGRGAFTRPGNALSPREVDRSYLCGTGLIYVQRNRNRKTIKFSRIQRDVFSGKGRGSWRRCPGQRMRAQNTRTLQRGLEEGGSLKKGIV